MEDLSEYTDKELRDELKSRSFVRGLEKEARSLLLILIIKIYNYGR